MNFQKMVRMQVMVIAAGAGLFLARPAQAQQDVNPTQYDDSYNMVPLNQPASAQDAKLITVSAPGSLETKQKNAAETKSAASSALMTLLLGGGSLLLIGSAAAVGDTRRRGERA
jgi:hypothetical protein